MAASSFPAGLQGCAMRGDAGRLPAWLAGVTVGQPGSHEQCQVCVQ